MSHIEQILELERDNDRQIRLYRMDNRWFAFERSAFNLFSVYYVDSILKIKDMEEKGGLLIAIVKDGVHGLLCNPQFSVLKSSDNEVLIDCRVTCGGFLHWKDSLVPVSSISDPYHASYGVSQTDLLAEPEYLAEWRLP